MKLGHQIRTADGKFGEKPRNLMPVDDALKLMGNPPATWTPYFQLDAARALHEAGLCLLAQRRSKNEKGLGGPMVRVWKASK
jgi:hypothetical protein